MLFHQSQAKYVIGRGGDKIKYLRNKHSLDMTVYYTYAPKSKERVCQMKGKLADIVSCLREVIILLESVPPYDMSSLYKPNNFNKSISSQYGGFVFDELKQPNMSGGNNRSQQNNNRGGGSGGGGDNFNNNNVMNRSNRR